MAKPTTATKIIPITRRARHAPITCLKASHILLLPRREALLPLLGLIPYPQTETNYDGGNCDSEEYLTNVVDYEVVEALHSISRHNFCTLPIRIDRRGFATIHYRRKETLNQITIPVKGFNEALWWNW